MSKSIKSIVVLGFVATMAACTVTTQTDQNLEEFVVVDTAPVVPVTVEPAYTGKFK